MCMFANKLPFNLRLAFDRTVLYGTIPFSVITLLTQKWYTSFLKKDFVSKKICLKVMETFKTSGSCHIKMCRFHKRNVSHS